ncbi:MAG: FemAB family XrtA/PEP-CTERM system-associated protein [Gammaproteobacteria bacterium]
MEPSFPEGTAPDSRRKQLREAKQLCARRFGEAKRAGLDTAELKVEMQRITQALAALDASENNAAPAESAPQPTPPRLPRRFAAQAPGISEREAADAQIHRATPADDAAWDGFVRAHPAASLYHLSVWRRLIVNDMGHRDISLVAKSPGGAVLGVLPLIEIRSRLFGNFAVSMPYFNYGGPLALHPLVEERLMARAAEVSAEHGLKHAEIRETRPRSGWPARDHKVLMIRALPASEAELDAGLGSKLRAQVKRAEREQPAVQIGGAELLDAFYAAFARNMRDLGTPVYGKPFFRAVVAAWPERSHVVAVTLRGRPVGGAILLGFQDVLEIPWASTVRDVSALGLNMLMYRAILGFAIREGYGYFDFGRSTRDVGTYHFKRQWGAEPVGCHWQYWLEGGRGLPELNPSNPRFRLFIAGWKRLPLWAANFLGYSLARALP